MITRRTVLTSSAASAATLATFPLLADSAYAAPALGSVLAKGFVVPWGLAFLPSGDALVTERISGRVHRVRRNGGRRPVGTIAGVDANGEGGLMGCAVSPTFGRDSWVYFYLTASSDNRVIRMRYSDGALSSRQNVLTGIPKAAGHNGGRLAFGPGGRLFVSTGDATTGRDAQDRSTLAGKILRLEPNGSVPADNPFGASNPVWTYGHRNVQGLAWDNRGRMFATEFGQETRDELNVIRAGHNYGWPNVEGGDGAGGYHDPYVIWRPTSYCSPSGLAIANGRAWVGALRGEALFAVGLFGRNARRKTRYFHERLGRIRTVAKAPDGSLWVTTSNRDGRGSPRANDDKVIRVRLS